MFLWAKYGTQTDIRFPIVKRGVVDLAATADWTPATGDTKVSKDGGSFANSTNNPAAVAGTGSVGWKLTLTATELQCAELNIQIVDAATKAVEDQFLTVYTYGNAAAKIQADLSDVVRLGLTALPGAAADAAGGIPISDAGGLDLDTKLAATNEVTAARMAALTDWINGGRLDLILDIIAADVAGLDGAAMRGTDNAALASVCTEARLAELDAANLPTDVAAVKSDTAATLADTGTDGVVVAAASKTGYALSSAGIQAIWDALTSALTTAGSIGKKLADWVIGTTQTGDSFARLGAPDGASVSADIAAAKADTAAIKAKTDNLPATPAATGDIPSAASIATAVFTTQLTEAYAADGVAPTLAQALFMLLGSKYEFAISGDTLTVKKLDGSTTAMAFTLAPPGGPYTSITRIS